jgi:hypothetical protein
MCKIVLLDFVPYLNYKILTLQVSVMYSASVLSVVSPWLS